MVENQELEPYQKELLEWKGKGFDLRTHIRDPKTGKMLKEQPYSYVVSKEEGSYFIRDGKRYTEQGVLIGTQDVKAKPEKK